MSVMRVSCLRYVRSVISISASGCRPMSSSPSSSTTPSSSSPSSSSIRAQLRMMKSKGDNPASSANPVALVTGGSRGIGRAIALALAGSGCKVIVNYSKNETAALEVCAEIARLHGAQGAIGVPLKCGVSDYEDVQRMFLKIITEVGPIDILVNNAGITRDMLAVKMKPTDFSDVINLNLNGVFYCSQAAFLFSMMGQKKGRIVNISSVVGQIGNQGQANYAAAKGGVISLTRSLAKEFAGRGVTVNAVCPGFIESDMTQGLKREGVLPLIPLGRYGTAEEVAGLVRFLALDPSGAYMTGHCFNIDGGLAIGAT